MMKLIHAGLLDELIEKAEGLARKRINHNVHESSEDPVQKLFVAARTGSYFRPHRHPGKREFALVIRGLFDVVFFDDDGQVIRRITIGPDADAVGFEVGADTWHSWVPLRDGSVFFEVKQGPYDPLKASEFAPWSAEEGSPGASGYAARIRDARIGDRIVH